MSPISSRNCGGTYATGDFVTIPATKMVTTDATLSLTMGTSVTTGSRAFTEG